MLPPSRASRTIRHVAAPPLVWTGLVVLLLACVAVSVGVHTSARAVRTGETSEAFRRWLELFRIERDLVFETERMETLALFNLVVGTHGEELVEAQAAFHRQLETAETSLEGFVASGSQGNGAAQRLLRMVSDFRRTQPSPDSAVASLHAVSELYTSPDWIPLTSPDGEWFELCTYIYDLQIATYYPIETVDEYLARHWEVARPRTEPEVQAHIESVVAYLNALDLQPRDATSTRWMLDPLLDVERARELSPELAMLVGRLRIQPGAQVLRDLAPFLLHGSPEPELQPQDVLDRMMHYAETLRAGAQEAIELADATIARKARREHRRSAVVRGLAVLLTGLAIAVLIRIELQRRRFNRRLLTLAETDPLTHLGNRFALQSIERPRLLDPKEGGFALIQLDLDNFKAINDSLGHHAGDQALIAFADRCRSAVRQDDLVTRIGGDEFVIVLHRLQDPERRAREVAQRIEESLAEPIDCGGRVLRLQVSTGIATSLGPVELDELMVEADLALYAAKETGRNRHEVFADANRRLLVRELPPILAEQRLAAAFQPQIELSTGEVVGLEALVRWPLDRSMPAGKIIEVIEWLGESRGLLRTMLARVEEAHAATYGLFHGRFWLNLSPLDILAADAASALLEIFESSAVPIERLGVEITETLPILDFEQAISVVSRLRAAGVEVAIDDFGSQNTPLRHLTRFQVDCIKLDRSVVSRIDSDTSNRVLAEAVRIIAEAHGTIVLAEGVETVGEMTTVRELRIRRAQGFAIARPIPAGEIGDFLRHWLPHARSDLDRAGADPLPVAPGCRLAPVTPLSSERRPADAEPDVPRRLSSTADPGG